MTPGAFAFAAFIGWLVWTEQRPRGAPGLAALAGRYKGGRKPVIPGLTPRQYGRLVDRGAARERFTNPGASRKRLREIARAKLIADPTVYGLPDPETQQRVPHGLDMRVWVRLIDRGAHAEQIANPGLTRNEGRRIAREKLHIDPTVYGEAESRVKRVMPRGMSNTVWRRYVNRGIYREKLANPRLTHSDAREIVVANLLRDRDYYGGRKILRSVPQRTAPQRAKGWAALGERTRNGYRVALKRLYGSYQPTFDAMTREPAIPATWGSAELIRARAAVTSWLRHNNVPEFVIDGVRLRIHRPGMRGVRKERAARQERIARKLAEAQARAVAQAREHELREKERLRTIVPTITPEEAARLPRSILTTSLIRGGPVNVPDQVVKRRTRGAGPGARGTHVFVPRRGK